MADEFTAKFKVDITDLKKNIDEANKQIKLANSTFKSETAGMDKWANNADGLSKKLNNLKDVLENQKTILSAYKGQLEKQQEAYEENGKRAEQLKQKLQELASQGVAKTDAEYQKYEKALKTVLKEQQNNGKAVEDLKIQILDQQAAVATTERSINHYSNSLADVEKKSKSLTNTVSQQEKTLADLKADYTDIVAAQGKNSASAKELAKQIENLSGDLKDNKAKLNDAEQEAQKLDKSIDELGDSADKAGGKFDGLGSKIATGLKAGLAAAGTAIAGATAALASATVSAAAYADEMITMSSVTGMSTDALQAYNYAADLVDVSLDTLTGSMAKNVKSMSNAANGSANYAAAYDKLGVSVTDANGQLRNSEDVYWDVIDALGNVANETERDAIAMQLFGKSAQELNPLIAQGSEGIAKLTEEAKAMGAVMSEDALAQLGAFDDSLQRLKGGANAAKNALGMVLLPQLQVLADDGIELIGQFTRGLNEANGDWTKISEVIGNTVGGMADMLLEQLPNIMEVGVNIVSSLASAIINSLPKLTEAGIQILETLISNILSALPNVVNVGVQLIDSLLTGLGQAIPNVAIQVVQIVPQIVQALIDAIPQLIEGAVQFFMAIVDAIPRLVSELQLALPNIVNTIINGLTHAIPQLLNGALQLFQAIVDAIPQILPILTQTLPQIIQTITHSLSSWLPQLLDGAIALLMAIVSAVPEIIPPLVEALPIIVTGIIDALVAAIPTLLDGAVTFLMAIVQAIPQIVTELAKQIPTIVKAIVDVLINNIPTLISGAVQLFMGIIQAIPQIVVELAAAMPQIISAIVGGLIGGIGEVFAAAGELFFGIVDRSKAAQEEIAKQNEAIYAYAQAMADTSPQLADYNQLLSDQGNTIADLDTKTRETENAITEVIRTALQEQRGLREEDLQSIQEYMDELTRLQEEKLQIYRSQQIAELKKLQLESGEITQETAAQHLANTEAALEAANKATEDGYTARLTTIEQKYQAMGEIGSAAYKAELEAAKAAYDEQLAENESYYTNALEILETKSAEWVKIDGDKWAELNKQMSAFNTESENGFNNFLLKANSWLGNFGGVKDDYLETLSEMDRKNAQGFLNMAAQVKSKGGEIDDETRTLAANMLGAFDNLPDDLDEAGKDALMGMIYGLEDYIPELHNTSEMSANEIVDTIKEYLGIASPSKVLKEVGENTIQGFIDGMESLKQDVVNVGEEMAKGLWQGFKSQEESLTSKVKSMMRRIVSAARKEMKINSPSKVWGEIGDFMAQGLGVGFVKEMRSVTKDIQNAMPKAVANDMLDGLQGRSAGTAAAGGLTNNNKTVNFTQIINAPKQPSRIELYRQTRNLLSYANATGSV